MKCRRPANLRPLLDHHLLAEPDAPVTGEVHGKRPCRRAGRRILRDALPWREHAALPACAHAREDTEGRAAECGEPPEIRLQPRDRLWRRELDEYVMRTVVVEL